MRLIGHLHDPAEAERFGGLLFNRGIEHQIEPDDKGRAIWVLAEDQIDTAQTLLEAFQQRPADPAFTAEVQAGLRKRTEAEAQAAQSRARTVDARTAFRPPAMAIGIVTLCLMVLSIGVTVLTRMGKDERYVRPLQISEVHEDQNGTAYYRTDLPEVRHGQVWRLFTPMFLHFGLLHIFFNMLWIKDLGTAIERDKGPWYLLVLVLTISGLSNLPQYLVSGPRFGGMSGVVFGLLGYIWMQGKFNPASRLRLTPQTVQFMILWFFICLTGLAGPVANTVHGAGALTGMAWGYIAAKRA